MKNFKYFTEYASTNSKMFVDLPLGRDYDINCRSNKSIIYKHTDNVFLKVLSLTMPSNTLIYHPLKERQLFFHSCASILTNLVRNHLNTHTHTHNT